VLTPVGLCALSGNCLGVNFKAILRDGGESQRYVGGDVNGCKNDVDIGDLAGSCSLKCGPNFQSLGDQTGRLNCGFNAAGTAFEPIIEPASFRCVSKRGIPNIIDECRIDSLTRATGRGTQANDPYSIVCRRLSVSERANAICELSGDVASKLANAELIVAVLEGGSGDGQCNLNSLRYILGSRTTAGPNGAAVLRSRALNVGILGDICCAYKIIASTAAVDNSVQLTVTTEEPPRSEIADVSGEQPGASFKFDPRQ
jgi:hypothetical protein